MKLQVMPADLKAAMAVASTAVAPRATLPILGYVLFEASTDGGLTLSGTTTETRAWRTVQAQIEAPGAVALPTGLIQSFLGATDPTSPVSIDVKANNKGSLTCGGTTIKVSGLDAEEFPVAPRFDLKEFDATVSMEALATLTRSVACAIATDTSDLRFAGVFIQAQTGVLRMVTFDRYRLAVRSTEIDGLPDIEVLALGKQFVEAVSKASNATSARLIVDADQYALMLDTEVGCWAIRLVSEKFPDWPRFVRRESPTVVTVGRSALLSAVELGQSLASSGNNLVCFRVGPDSLTVSASDGYDTATAKLCATVSGDEILFGLNGKYVVSALRALEGDAVHLGIRDPGQNVTAYDDSGIDRHAHSIGAMHITNPAGVP